MPKKYEEFVIRIQERGKKEQPIAGPYFQRREAVRHLTRLLTRCEWSAAVRAVVYERPAPNGSWRGRSPDDRKHWTPVARGEKKANSRQVEVTERYESRSAI